MRGRWTALLSAAVLSWAAPGFGQDHVGINVHVPADDLLDQCVAAGVSWVRMDGDWAALNPARGRYEWAALDRAVDAARQRGLEVFVTLAYTPAWVPRVSRGRSDTYPGNDEPAQSDEWRAFVTEATRRYRARGVRHFGIWNEPNLDQFWERAAGVDAYIDKVLLPGAAAVRAACADCRVLGPDLAHLSGYETFLTRVLSRALSSFDIIAHHIYKGWPETGTTLFDGDTFVQALEQRRFAFTQPSLRELLDAAGYRGEVWITETGYRAVPVGDAAQEARQATYVRRVLEEQLARPWWTHTFFYEVTDCGVDQAGCPIDGFGLSRPLRSTASGPRRSPSDYRLKPAYTALRDFIAANPAIVSRGAATACSNGRDDDGDGRIDADDRGCASAMDNNESDDPPRLAVVAWPVAAGTVRVDGDLAEWRDAGWRSLDGAGWVGPAPWGGADDLSLRFAARYDADALYLAVEARDDRHVNDREAPTLWVGDSLQVAFDLGRNYRRGYDATDDHEFGLGLLRGGATVVRFHGPRGVTATGVGAVRRTGSVTAYELALPAAALGGVALAAGSRWGFSLLVNDHDGVASPEGNGREGWIELTPGVGIVKDPYQFAELLLAPSEGPMDAGVVPTDAGAGAGDAGAGDAGAGDAGGVARDAAVDTGARTDAHAAGDAGGGDAGAAVAQDVGLREAAGSGCGCRVAARRGTGRGAALGWAMVLGAALRRRRVRLSRARGRRGAT